MAVRLSVSLEPSGTSRESSHGEMGVPVGISATRFSFSQIIRYMYMYFLFPMGHKYKDIQFIHLSIYLLTEEKSPGAYTKVINYIQWIQEMVASHP